MEFRLQLSLHELPAGVARKWLVAPHDLLGNLVCGQSVGEERPQLIGDHLLTWVQQYRCGDDLAEPLIG